MIDLIASSGSHKDEKLINFIRKNYIKNNSVTNVCFIYGQGDDYDNHVQISTLDLRKLVFEYNNKDTIYFLAGFYFDKDRENYLKLIEDICESDIQIFKTDQVKEHVTNDIKWLDKYVEFITIGDL